MKKYESFARNGTKPKAKGFFAGRNESTPFSNLMLTENIELGLKKASFTTASRMQCKAIHFGRSSFGTINIFKPITLILTILILFKICLLNPKRPKGKPQS